MSGNNLKSSKVIDWIKSHQVAAFYLLAFAISWGLEFAYDASVNRGHDLLLPIVFIATCGPGIAGIGISAAINSQPMQGSRKSFLIAFLLAWLISLLVLLARFIFLDQVSITPVMVGLFAVAVLPVAFVIASAYSRNPSVRSYLVSLVRLRGVWGWSFVALWLIPALFLISVSISAFLGGQASSSNLFPEISFSLLGLVAVKFLYQFFFFNATGEETGWRGFVLPRMQARISPLLASLIIGFFWASWHFPYWRSDGRPVLTVEFWLEMWTAHILLSILIVWLCNRAKGSILVAGIAHAALNTYQAFAPFSNSLFLVLLTAALVVILVDRMWERLAADHPAVYQEPLSIKFRKGIKKEELEVSNV